MNEFANLTEINNFNEINEKNENDKYLVRYKIIGINPRTETYHEYVCNKPSLNPDKKYLLLNIHWIRQNNEWKKNVEEYLRVGFHIKDLINKDIILYKISDDYSIESHPTKYTKKTNAGKRIKKQNKTKLKKRKSKKQRKSKKR